jgi:hypothetical protein
VNAKSVDRFERVVTYLILLVGGFLITYVGSWALSSMVGDAAGEIFDYGRLAWSILATLIALAFYHQMDRPIP